MSREGKVEAAEAAPVRAAERAGVPRLRFPGFERPWRQSGLSFLIGTLDAGVSVNSTDERVGPADSGVLKTSCVTDGVFDATEAKRVDDPTEIARLREPVQAETVIISRMNTPALVGASAFVPIDMPNLYLPDRLWAAKPSDQTNPRWLGYLLGMDRTRASISERATGTSGSMKNLSKGALLSLEVLSTSRAEQDKIASFLSSIDIKLEALTQEQDALTLYKTGLAQKLFSQETRFSGFAAPWETTTIRQIFDFHPTNSLSRADLTDEAGDLLNIHYGDIHSRLPARLNAREYALPWVREEKTPVAARQRPVQSGDVVIADASEDLIDVGKAVEIIDPGDVPIVAGLHTVHASPRPGHALAPGFAAYLFRSAEVRRGIEREAHGTKVVGLSPSRLGLVQVRLPEMREQAKIADALSSLDDRIAAVAAQITRMEAFKKGLLQQMFV